MAYIVGTALALLTGIFLMVTGFERDRAVYPTLVIVIALYYVLFAVMGGSPRALIVESVVMLVFGALAVMGFATNLWWIVPALAGHGVFDYVHGHMIANPGVPAWWPAWCLSYDVCFASWLGWRLYRGAIQAARPVSS